MNKRIEKSLEKYYLARRHKDNKLAYNLYVDSFYLRCTHENYINLEFSSFFRYHFVLYLLSRKSRSISLVEGDMIADLIKSTYDIRINEINSSPFILDFSGKWNLLKNTEIIFPGYFETISL